VIYRVIKVITDANNRASDSVKIMFSEKIQGPNKTAFAITNQPPNTFWVWWGNTSVSADSLLNGIANFTGVGDSVLYFTMSNRKDLTAQNWMNIETSSIVICDRLGNTPKANNRKVPVEIQTISIIKTFPNPAVASKITINGTLVDNVFVEIVKPGEKSAVERKVGTDGKGSVISIAGINIPKDPEVAKRVTLTMKIYDVAGNSVTWIPRKQLFTGTELPGTSVFLLWDGFNNAGMKSAPGVYRAVLYVDYPAQSDIKDIKLITTLGIRQ